MEKRISNILLVGNLERKGPLGRPMSRLVNNDEKNLIETGRGSMDWIGLGYDRTSGGLL
jgi:hypothetical protein